MGRLEELWLGRGGAWAPVRAALWPFSLAYGAVMSARGRLYDVGALPTHEPMLPAISVGNLTVGGTGKTPVAAWLAARLAATARPAIVLRGYGSDEAEVHARLNPGVPVITNRDRAAAIREAHARGADVVVLDDAFQHRRVGRTADVLLLSVEQLLRPRRLLPAGPWREPLSSARRADLLILTRKSASAEQVRQAGALVQRSAPEVPMAVVRLDPHRLVHARDGSELPLDRLRGTSVLGIAAIGEPEMFRMQLEGLGASVTLAAFRDHHPFTAAEIGYLASRIPANGLAVCTLKDAVKLARLWPASRPLWYVSQQLTVEQGAAALDGLLEHVLEARLPTANTAG